MDDEDAGDKRWEYFFSQTLPLSSTERTEKMDDEDAGDKRWEYFFSQTLPLSSTERTENMDDEPGLAELRARLKAEEMLLQSSLKWQEAIRDMMSITPRDKIYNAYQAVCSRLEPLHDTLSWDYRGFVEMLGGFPRCSKSDVLNERKGKMHRTLLHFAAEKNFQNSTRLLLTISDISVNEKDSARCTPLHLACREGLKEIIKSLLQHPGVYVNAEDRTGCRPLHLACIKGFKEITQLLLQDPQILVNLMDSMGCTPLHLACSKGFEEITQLLLQHPQIDVNVKDSMGYTPLFLACREGFQEITKLLLQHPQIDVNAGDITPLHSAAFRGNDWAVCLLVQHPDIDLYSRTEQEEMTALHMAACKGHANIVRMILDAESRPDVDGEVPLVINVDRLKRTPLHYAAYEQRLDVVKELLQSPGLDVNIGDDRSFTALHLAVLRGHVTIVQLLLNHQNIDLDIVTKCISEDDLETVRGWQEDVDWRETPRPRLIDYIPHQKVAGMTALHFALELVEVELATEDRFMERMMGVVNVLLAHPNIDINIENEHGESPLSVALRRKLGPILMRLFGRYEDMVHPCVHLLRSYCKKGELDLSVIDPVLEKLRASLNRLNLKIDVAKFDTLSLIHKAAIVGKEELLSVLVDIQQLGDINAEDGDKRTPLHYATIAGQTKSIQLLLMSPGLRANHEDLYNKTALQIAFETEQKDIEKQLLEKPEVKDWLDRIYRDRQLYSDATNAILVGAALIAGVTYGGWLQPPLGYTQYYEFPVSDPAPPDTYQVFAAVKQYMTIRIFWVCNILSFFLAIAAALSGATAVLPMSDVFITEEVRTLRRYLLVTALFVMFAVVFVLVAFTAAGFASLPPILNLEMIISSVIGGIPHDFENLKREFSLSVLGKIKRGEIADGRNQGVVLLRLRLAAAHRPEPWNSERWSRSVDPSRVRWIRSPLRVGRPYTQWCHWLNQGLPLVKWIMRGFDIRWRDIPVKVQRSDSRSDPFELVQRGEEAEFTTWVMSAFTSGWSQLKTMKDDQFFRG
ncbi:hypothetical protein R1sor_020474 [Riccia sorocarpa]|uniref:PGG domain-containing protein n=1 Tax=Riccia sorocarpa TaxID=122646 RepID=A0ABD3IFN7_9MARC